MMRQLALCVASRAWVEILTKSMGFERFDSADFKGIYEKARDAMNIYAFAVVVPGME